MKFLSLCLLEIDFVQDTMHTQIVLFHQQLLSLSALYTMFEISEGIKNAWWTFLTKTKAYQGWITILQAPVWGHRYIMNKGTNFWFLKSNYSKRKTVLMEWVTSCTCLKWWDYSVILIRISDFPVPTSWNEGQEKILYSILIEPFFKGIIQHSQTFLFLHVHLKTVFQLRNYSDK